MMCITLFHMEQSDQAFLRLSLQLSAIRPVCSEWVRAAKSWRTHWQDTDASFSLLRQFVTNEADRIEDWRKALIGEITTWTGKSLEDFSQRSFWRSFENFDRDIEKALASTQSLDAAELVAFDAGEMDLSTRIATLPTNTFDVFVVDGQQKLQFPPPMELYHILDQRAVRSLSLRAIRALTQRAAREISSAEIASVASLLLLTREVLAREVCHRVRWRIVLKRSFFAGSVLEMVREDILSFKLRTGNPPSFDQHERRTGAVVVPGIFIQASKVKHEQVCNGNSRRDLRVAFRERRRSASFNRNSQTPPPAYGCAQPAGRRCVRTHLQLDEGTRQARYPGRGEVVLDLRVGGRGGAIRNLPRAKMTAGKGIQ